MPIIGLSDLAVSSGSSGDRADGKVQSSLGPGGIYHEKQVGALCAVHCVNNLLQGPLFDEGSFGDVSQELDRAELQLTGGQALDHGNARMDGYFNVQVMQAVLGRAGYDMVPLAGEAAQNVQADTAKEKGFILNKEKHWFVLRRIGSEWFDLNSCLKTPQHYTDSDLRFHIRDAVREGYSVFAVQGDFPRCALEEDASKMVEAVQGSGRPGQGYSLFAGSGNRLDSGQGLLPVVTGVVGDADTLRSARLLRFGGGDVEAPPARRTEVADEDTVELDDAGDYSMESSQSSHASTLPAVALETALLPDGPVHSLPPPYQSSPIVSALPEVSAQRCTGRWYFDRRFLAICLFLDLFVIWTRQGLGGNGAFRVLAIILFFVLLAVWRCRRHQRVFREVWRGGGDQELQDQGRALLTTPP